MRWFLFVIAILAIGLAVMGVMLESPKPGPSLPKGGLPGDGLNGNGGDGMVLVLIGALGVVGVVMIGAVLYAIVENGRMKRMKKKQEQLVARWEQGHYEAAPVHNGEDPMAQLVKVMTLEVMQRMAPRMDDPDGHAERSRRWPPI